MVLSIPISDQSAGTVEYIYIYIYEAQSDGTVKYIPSASLQRSVLNMTLNCIK